MRNGKIEVIHNNFLHVGDIIYVEYGMAIPVDGICLQAVQLMADEAAMTGESDEVKKEPLAKCLSYQKGCFSYSGIADIYSLVFLLVWA